VEEVTRIGSVEGTGPDVFGQISTFEVDPAGRVWVYEGQAEELRVFDASGAHVRTIGRRGGGPGEFAQAVKVEVAPDGNVWVMDPQNNRISVFDTAGNYLEAKRAAGGFIIMPWPGGFDAAGRYYAPVPLTGENFRIGLVRYDASLTPIDTLATPRDPVDRESFEHRVAGGGRMIAGVPFQGGLRWLLSPNGTIWAMITDQYRLFELTPEGDTLRTVTRAFNPLPVTDADREQAREDMEWFTEQGGQVDWSKLPATKPATRSFFFDDEGYLWVERVTASPEEHAADIFDPDGRFLGTIDVPFAIASRPIIRGGILHTVTRDELEVPYIVRARILKP
jgi:hypothetical protein